MKKFICVLSAVLVLVFSAFAAEGQQNTITIRSFVGDVGNPGVTIAYNGTNSISGITEIDALDLSKGGSYEFLIVTTEDVKLVSDSTKPIVVEVVADGFHQYPSGFSGTMSSDSNSDSNIVKRNAVPLSNGSPQIEIVPLEGEDQNVTVEHLNSAKSKVAITFREGETKGELVVAKFYIKWNPVDVIDAGVYKARISISYSTF